MTIDWDEQPPEGAKVIARTPTGHVVYDHMDVIGCTCKGFRFRRTCKHSKSPMIYTMTVSELMDLLRGLGYELRIVPHE